MYEFGVNTVATLEAGQNARANGALEEHGWDMSTDATTLVGPLNASLYRMLHTFVMASNMVGED
jgi:hypothetical protein